MVRYIISLHYHNEVLPFSTVTFDRNAYHQLNYRHYIFKRVIAFFPSATLLPVLLLVLWYFLNVYVYVHICKHSQTDTHMCAYTTLLWHILNGKRQSTRNRCQWTQKWKTEKEIEREREREVKRNTKNLKSIDAYPVIKCMRCKDTRFTLAILHCFDVPFRPFQTSFSSVFLLLALFLSLLPFCTIIRTMISKRV